MINNLAEAVWYFRAKCLENKSVHTGYFYGKKGPIAERIVDQRIPKIPVGYAVFFKRDWFHVFGRFYPQTYHKGEGQTINLKALKDAVVYGDIIAVVMPDESVWVCPANVWLSYVRKHNTIRTPSTEIGEEASIPVTMMREWFTNPNHLGNIEPITEPKTKASLDGWM